MGGHHIPSHACQVNVPDRPSAGGRCFVGTLAHVTYLSGSVRCSAPEVAWHFKLGARLKVVRMDSHCAWRHGHTAGLLLPGHNGRVIAPYCGPLPSWGMRQCGRPRSDL